MAGSRYLTAPDPNETGWPKGVPYIIGNEGCERFSFYGMKSILQVHLTMLFVGSGLLTDAAEEHAQEMVHLFVAGVYALPMIGAIISDRLAGKYGTIMILSLVYCLGHLVLAIGENSIAGMTIGLALISIGSGGIKPCVSAHVGDQFGKGNWHLVQKVFQAFYFIINFGSFFATLMIPWIWHNKDLGPSVAFGLPGVLMFLATIAFWMGRKVFVHVQPTPGGQLGLLDTISSLLLFLGFIALPLFVGLPTLFAGHFPGLMYWLTTAGLVVMGLWIFEERRAIQQDDGFLSIFMYSLEAMFKRQGSAADRPSSSETDSEDSIRRHWFFGPAAEKFGGEAAEGPRAVLRIISVFFMVSVFWALFDQHASSWIRQAQRMNLTVNLGFMELELLASQISALNPLMVMALIPFNNFFLYPLFERSGFRMTPLRRMTIGMAVASLAFAVVALLQMRIDAGEAAAAAAADPAKVSKVSVLWQVLPYLIMTQAEVMVSITGLEFAYTQAPARMKSTIMGFWLLTVSLGNVLVAALTRFSGQGLAEFFWTFTGLMGGAALLFGLRASFYRYRDYTQ